MLSPNYESRGGLKPEIVVIHIGDGSLKSILAEIKNPLTEKAYHYLINMDTGEVINCVDEKMSAWANGIVWNPASKIVKERYLKNISINKISISIAASGFANDNPTETYYKSASKLLKEVCERNGIPIDSEHVIPHHSVRRDKTCPGRISTAKLIDMAKNPPIQPEIPTPMFEIPTPMLVAPIETVDKISLLRSLLDLYKQLLSLLLERNKLGGKARSGGWWKVRNDFLKEHPLCAFHGGKGTILNPLNIHHLKMFHKYPGLELDLDNLITACRFCHFWYCHKGNWSTANPTAKEDAAYLLAKIQNHS